MFNSARVPLGNRTRVKFSGRWGRINQTRFCASAEPKLAFIRHAPYGPELGVAAIVRDINHHLGFRLLRHAIEAELIEESGQVFGERLALEQYGEHRARPTVDERLLFSKPRIEMIEVQGCPGREIDQFPLLR